MEPIQDNRLRNLARLTGIMLILGFVLPIVMPGGRGGQLDIMFPNISLLGNGMIPFGVKFWLFLPLVSGALAFVAMGQAKNMSRVVIWAIAGFLPWLVGLLASTGGVTGMMGGAQALGPLGSMFSSGGVFSFFASVGIMLLISGAVAGIVRDKHPIPAIIAAVGGGMLLLSLFLPVGVEEMLLITMPFKILELAPVTALISIVVMGLMIAACILSIIWAFKSQEGVNHGWTIRNLLLGALTVLIVASLVSAAVNTPGKYMALMMLTLVFAFAKIIFFAGGLLFAKCMFIIELTAYDHSPLGGLMNEPKSSPDGSISSTAPNPPSSDSGTGSSQGGDSGINLDK